MWRQTCPASARWPAARPSWMRPGSPGGSPGGCCGPPTGSSRCRPLSASQRARGLAAQSELSWAGALQWQRQSRAPLARRSHPAAGAACWRVVHDVGTSQHCAGRSGDWRLGHRPRVRPPGLQQVAERERRRGPRAPLPAAGALLQLARPWPRCASNPSGCSGPGTRPVLVLFTLQTHSQRCGSWADPAALQEALPQEAPLQHRERAEG